MRLPVIRGLIDRRILVNYRVEPDVLAAILPPPFRPQVIRGFGMSGICLIRLCKVRPRGFPSWLGLSSENAAHRIAVEWHDGDQIQSGVYVLRRDTSSRLNALAGGRIFPGLHHRGTFRVRENDAAFEVALDSDDGCVSMQVFAKLSHAWPSGSIFASLAEASSFFEAGSLGYSPSAETGRFQGLELRCRAWWAEPLAIDSVRSSLFDDETVFPHGSVTLDCGLLMRGIEHEWHGQGDLCCGQTMRRSTAPCVAAQAAVSASSASSAGSVASTT